jgi:hypothetical protein
LKDEWDNIRRYMYIDAMEETQEVYKEIAKRS